jgi:eukaryotic-like serine/threonine-protein kinase
MTKNSAIPKTIGNYDIQEELGRGGMGVVYKAFESALNRTVALKVLGESVAHQPGLVERFYREARSMAALSDPNVVQIHAVGQHEGQPYFVMEFIAGESLAQRLKRDRLSVPQCRQLLSQACKGLQAAHEMGILHRDIKPGNLMLTPRGLLKVTDFGIALGNEDSGERLTGTGGIVGTPGYLSPEACLGEPLDARTDIFALGVVMYEMLTGRLPFDDKSPFALMAAVVQAQIPDVRLLNKDVDAGTFAVLQRMLARRPDERFQTCAEVVAALEQTPAHLSAPPLPAQTYLNQSLPPQHTPPPSYAPPQAYTPPPQSYAPQPAYTPPPPQNYPPQQAYTPPPQSYPPQQAYTPPPQSYAPEQQGYAPQPMYTPPPVSYAPQYQPAHPQTGVILTAPKASASGNRGWIIGVGLAGAIVLGLMAIGYVAQSSTTSDPVSTDPVSTDPISTDTSSTSSDSPTNTDATGESTPAATSSNSTGSVTPAEQPLIDEPVVTPTEPVSTDGDTSKYAAEIFGTYTGLIDQKTFKLVLQDVNADVLSGYNIANQSRRPVTGKINSISEDIDSDGDTWKVYDLSLSEPGDQDFDGVFNLQLRHTEKYVGGKGTWTGNKNQEVLAIEIKGFSAGKE